MSLNDWSVTAADNNDAPPYGAPEGMTLANVNNVFRQIMADVRTLAATDSIAAAATTDVATKNAAFVTVNNVSTAAVAITSLGSTATAGLWKVLVFNPTDAISLTHSASLILRSGANRTTVAGDVAMFLCESTGVWREVFYHASNVWQPLDSDLTAIAALTTTAFGRGMLEYANAATAFAALKQAATETATGVVELATTAEAETGTDTARAVTPAGGAAAIAALGLGGSGQTIQDVTASRASGATYTNSTGKPIVFYVSNTANAASSQIILYVDGVIVTESFFSVSGALSRRSENAVVPDGSTYSATIIGGAMRWMELR